MEQLSWTDDMMLRAERPETPMHIQMLLFYDPAGAPGGHVDFERISREVEARLHLAPAFRRRLTELPGRLHMPYWVDDPDFDLEYHLRHIGLPSPGDWRQLCTQIARIQGRQLDMSRPPWEMTVIEGLRGVPGLPDETFAVALKVHHCVVDGMESVELMTALHDLESTGTPVPSPEQPWAPGPLPSTLDLLSRTAVNSALHPVRAGKVLIPAAVESIRGAVSVPRKIAGALAATVASDAPSILAPGTRFNRATTPHRVFEARFHDLDDFKTIKRTVPDATINDVVLAYVGGALRHYLREHDELPESSLVAACPMSIRGTDERGDGGNRLFGRFYPVGTDTEDPLERLAAITAQTVVSRESDDAVQGSKLVELAGVVPTALLGLTVKAASALPVSVPTIINTNISNVRGPADPVFFAGAKLLQVTGLGPLIGGMNLFHVAASYNGTISVGATADRGALPDPAVYGDCMQASFDELLSAAS